MNISNNKILITGGGSGIGLGLTERFVQEGNTVIICGRRQDVLESVAQNIPGIITYTCDLSNEQQRVNLFEWIKAEHPDLNMLINNAGIQQWTNIDDEDFYSRVKQEIMINVETPVHLTSMFIKLTNLKTIMNVTSGLSFCPLTKVAVYSATKAFFHSFTLSMQHELLKKNIEVIELIPPALNTDLGGKGLHDYAPPVHEFIESIFTQLKAGNATLTFGMSEGLSKAGPEQLKVIFERMNTA
jgi:uncharacterized oxidoreductase